MQDRLSLYPGRVKLTPVSGQESIYDMERADEPTQIGTAINKANLLKDSTASMYGLDSIAVPDDVFVASVEANTGYIHITTKTSSGVVAGIPIIIDCVYAGKTGVNGKARISVPFGAHTVKVVRPMDIASVTPDTFDINVTDVNAIMLESTCVLSTATEATISTSGDYGFSDRVEDFDVCAVGGGGGGTATVIISSSYVDSAPGGGGGYVNNAYGLLASRFNAFSATVGAGGIGGSLDASTVSSHKHQAGKDGGKSELTSLLGYGVGATADGGKAAPDAGTYVNTGGNGGSGGGGAAVESDRGGGVAAAGTDGSDGETKQVTAWVQAVGGTGQGTTTKPFGESSRIALSPGGGGALVYSTWGAAGTTQTNGSPGVYSTSGAVSATKSTIMGAGGGSAASITQSGTVKGADGADGGFVIRWRFKS